MEQRISTKGLDKLYRDQAKRVGKSAIKGLVNENRLSEREDRYKSIFLSHSHLDKTLVEKIALLFRTIDTDIYIDWMDEAMPKVTDRNTAAKIKTKIENCHRFLFLATYAGLRSKWCDWELGLAYSTKKIDELAILPIESRNGKWLGSEYLQLYPVMHVDEMDLAGTTADKVTIVKEGIPGSISLEQWLMFR